MLTSLVANLISLRVVVAVAHLMGFRSGAGLSAWLTVAGILILFTLALTWIAVIPGLTARSVDGASAFSCPLIFLPFSSSAFVPTETMPGPVRAFADNQPVTAIVNVIRDLFTNQPVGSDIWLAVSWCVGILIAAFVLAMATPTTAGSRRWRRWTDCSMTAPLSREWCPKYRHGGQPPLARAGRHAPTPAVRPYPTVPSGHTEAVPVGAW